MKTQQFKNLKPGDAVMLAHSCRNYYAIGSYIEPGIIKGVFVTHAPAITGKDRNFAVVDFPDMASPTPRCGAFLEDLE